MKLNKPLMVIVNTFPLWLIGSEGGVIGNNIIECDTPSGKIIDYVKSTFICNTDECWNKLRKKIHSYYGKNRRVIRMKPLHMKTIIDGDEINIEITKIECPEDLNDTKIYIEFTSDCPSNIIVTGYLNNIIPMILQEYIDNFEE